MSLVEKLLRIPQPVVHLLMSPGSVFSLYCLAFALLLAFAFLAVQQKRRRRRVRPRTIARAIFARRVLFHRSTYADLGYFLIGTGTLGALFGSTVMSASALTNLVAASLAHVFGPRAPLGAPDLVPRVAMTGALFLAYELGYFIDHSLKHRIPALWALHKTHHTAEVLTPLTSFRVHPLDSLIFANILTLVGGLFGGAVTYALGQPIKEFALDGTNVLLVAYIYLTAQLQHSQIWIPFTGALGHVFLSPAHHQIHHSSDPAHYNRNMGASLAVWDWLFGSLEIPQLQSPRIKLGVRETEGAASDPHSVTALLLDPVVNAFGALARRDPRGGGGDVARADTGPDAMTAA
ncbi:MAG TPA: sterol desaturase family protein [Beijerinckiaceae bacterium]|nr:sterol desaturase family protein [Beijerinckiaceae bacterium]